MRGFCLITDIDGTLVGEEHTTRALRKALLAERAELARHGERLYWVIATGRRLDSTLEVLHDEGFAEDDFDALITAVGAELYLRGERTPDVSYLSYLATSGFQRRAVEHALAELDFLSPQPEGEQFAHKVSYFMPDTPENRLRVAEALATLPFATETVFSHDEYLDIAPSCGTKAGAVAHLLDRFGVPANRAVAAGDSGNDANMLVREWPAIVVGNGHRQLAALRGRPRVYFAEARYAAGVLEGLRALGFVRDRERALAAAPSSEP